MQYKFESNSKCYYSNPTHTSKVLKWDRSLNSKIQKLGIPHRSAPAYYTIFSFRSENFLGNTLMLVFFKFLICINMRKNDHQNLHKMHKHEDYEISKS